MKQWPTTRDTLLLKLAGEGQQHAWDEFYEIYQPVVYRYGRHRGLQHADAMELTQRVLVKVMNAAQRWSESGTPDRFRGWLRTVATNTLINLVTRESKYQGHGEAEPLTNVAQEDLTEGFWEAEKNRSVLRLAAKRIRPKFSDHAWKAFEMTMLAGVSVAESAQSLSTTTGAIYASRSRIIRALKDEAEKIMASSEEVTDA